MQGYKTKEILNPFFEMPKDVKELEKVYRTLAKSADQRLVRLEKYAQEENYQNVTKWAYARAMSDSEKWSGAEASRFNTAPPKHKLQLIAKINDIITFLESPTSTKAGISKMFQKRADTINDKYGTDLKWTDLGEFFESEFYHNLSERYDSDSIMKVLGKMYRNKDKVLKALKKSQEEKPVQYVSDDKVQNKIEKEILTEYPKEVRKLLS